MGGVLTPDYQHFELDAGGRLSQIGERMQAKIEALRTLIPGDLKGKKVLDVGCDFGFWCWLAADRGARLVRGLDRGRVVGDQGWIDLVAHNRVQARRHGLARCAFSQFNLGRNWWDTGERFDLVFVMSMYHHAYASCGDHAALWLWLSRQCAPHARVIWEGPHDRSDPVSAQCIPEHWQAGYEPDAIFTAAQRHFEIEYVGPALHEPRRHVYYLRAKHQAPREYAGVAVAGSGGATDAWDGLRIDEVQSALGRRMFPGTLNAMLAENFDFEAPSYPLPVTDLIDDEQVIGGEYGVRVARAYPVSVGSKPAHVFRLRRQRFDGEAYPHHFVELIAPVRLRDGLEQRDNAAGGWWSLHAHAGPISLLNLVQ